jgi:hypothetical protein
MNDAIERIESIKVGCCGGIAAAIASVGIGILSQRSGLTVETIAQLSIATAAASGGLFGIAYRYIIRGDRNHHLQSGAVLAFGLVRGLAKVNLDLSDLTIPAVVDSAAIVAASLILFEIVRYAIDYALWVGWILPIESGDRQLK